ncbi:MAG: aminopeptidase N [Planctomycetes bacterium]|nr:aminopeptidase N [Planctomycetota bacterium]
MSEAKNDRVVRLADYRPPAYLAPEIQLDFELGDDETRVRSRTRYRRNPDALGEPARLFLNGVVEELVGLTLDGESVDLAGLARLEGQGIEIEPGRDDFVLEVETRCRPQDNKTLEGLYRSGSMYCTQCEAEGFRRITFFQDRPDVMSVFTTRLTADAGRFPVLLANGNLVNHEQLTDGRHRATWHDPFKKPAYLFALVAGDLAMVEDRFRTMSGRDVVLRIFVDHGEEKKVAHALDSLKRAMRWDEEVYGREYDLDLFMIVAVHDFNFGAMENKGLNIFNASAVLAHHETATDADFERVEGVVAHEYFHNWSGNRVTLRDWFQLSLKEGFTVFRDQSFSADMNSAAVKRIDDVRQLRAYQFAEDMGPMAHPVRPESFVKIDNFYTTTVYEKGAEVVRMIHRLLGPERFRAGSDRYFARHDGQAVTCEDFVRAMEETSGVDLGHFRLWYSQAGTPRIRFRGHHDAAARRFELTISQETPPTPGQETKAALHIPVALGLLDAGGADLPLRLVGEREPVGTTRILELREPSQTFVFEDVAGPPVPSLLRGFSAPCLIETEIPRADLILRLAADSDGFNRWDAGQTLAMASLIAMTGDLEAGRPATPPEDLIEAFGKVLEDRDLDPALAAETLILPGESLVGDRMAIVRPDEIHAARQALRRGFARAHRDLLLARRDELAGRDQAGARRLKNLCLAYLSSLDDETSRALAMHQLASAGNMTDEIAALSALVDSESDERLAAFERFRAKWTTEPLVMNKWFALQAGSSHPQVADRVRELWTVPEFDEDNPNKLRALLGAFAMNQFRFHAEDGSGYELMIDKLIGIDRKNPQLAARLLTLMGKWKRFDEGRREKARAALERIAAIEHLSANSREVVARSLEG